MPMSPRLLRPIASGVHPEAAAWRTAVVANGGSVSASTMKAVSTFCAAIDAAGIRDRFFRLNLFCGENLLAALVPLYRGPSRTGTQSGNATETNIGPFVAGDYSETGSSTGGLKSDGATKYLQTGLNGRTLGWSVTSYHSAVYSKGTEAAGTSRYLIANTSDGTGNFGLGWLFIGAQERFHYGSALNGSASGLEGFLAGDVGSTEANYYYNGTSLSTGAGGSGTVNNAATNVMASSAGTLVTLARYVRGYSIGESMTGSQWTSYNTAMQAFQTALGRNV